MELSTGCPWNCRSAQEEAVSCCCDEPHEKVVTVSKHSSLANLTECLNVIADMLDDTNTNRPHIQVESVNAYPIYEERVTKENLLDSTKL